MLRELLPVTLLAGVATLVGVAVDGPPRAEVDGGPGECVEVWPEVRYGAFGYDHVVHLRNICMRTQECTVTTDVNPTAIQATVQPQQEVEVVTFRGSPARVFVPYATCHPQA